MKRRILGSLSMTAVLIAATGLMPAPGAAFTLVEKLVPNIDSYLASLERDFQTLESDRKAGRDSLPIIRNLGKTTASLKNEILQLRAYYHDQNDPKGMAAAEQLKASFLRFESAFNAMIAAGGGGAGKQPIQEYAIKKSTDVASPAMFAVAVDAFRDLKKTRSGLAFVPAVQRPSASSPARQVPAAPGGTKVK